MYFTGPEEPTHLWLQILLALIIWTVFLLSVACYLWYRRTHIRSGKVRVRLTEEEVETEYRMLSWNKTGQTFVEPIQLKLLILYRKSIGAWLKNRARRKKVLGRVRSLRMLASSDEPKEDGYR
ncbi:MAG: hypothetical protein P4L74_07365 [Candidatus Doudnabacteria bacterium]|nr:hypothetical protein [Candidatus Doudnabacteria bacterium]